MIRILIADDHQMFIDGLKSLLEHAEGIEIVGEALDGVEVLYKLEKQPADIVLMDINMPKRDGLATTKLVLEKYPDTKVIMLTMFNTPEFIQGLADVGAHGYILKNTGKEELMAAISAVSSGKTFYSQEVMQTMLRQNSKKTADGKTINDPNLSKREIEVLKLIAQEFTTQEIADKLFISQHTVETHRKNLLDKIGAKNIAGLVRYAIQAKMVE
jgi:DNA-binding NarL/FixJ family response regulator